MTWRPAFARYPLDRRRESRACWSWPGCESARGPGAGGISRAVNSGSRAWEGGGQEGLPPAVAKQRPGPSRMDGPDHLIDQHQFPILASSCEILPPGDLPASPRAAARGREELYPAAPSGPSPAAQPLRGDPHCLRQRPEGPETPCAPSWEPRTPRTRTGIRTRLGSRSGPALLERLGAGPAAASRDAGAGRTSGGCCSARGPQEPATRMVSGRAPDPGSCGWRGAEDASEYAGPLSGMRGSRCVSTSCLRCSD